MKFSENLETFSVYFAQFLESTSNFKHFDKEDDSCTLYISEITDYERHS